MTVRLCQRPRASCGACCGIYNRRDPGRGPVRAELARHTRVLARTERTPEAFRAAARKLAEEAPPPVFPSIRVCQLVGFLDAAETRIGCLAHPKATGGIDLRACGVYDVETCGSFLCPGHAILTEREAALLEAVTDFHLYGLVASDGPFLAAVLDGIAALARRPVEARDTGSPPFAVALRRLLSLKEELAPGSDGLFGAFHHGVSRGAPPADAEEARGRIVAALGADDRSGNDSELLELEVRARLDGCVAALRPGSPRPK